MHRIRDPIHGFIAVRPAEAALVDTPAFQRLRRIRQLGLTTYVYPGAEHTRFAHSLGACHVAGLLADSLRAAGWAGDPALVRLAALAHDLGHPPLSHAGERGMRHEAWTLRILRHPSVAEVLAAHDVDAEAVAALVAGEGDPVGAALVAGQLDADRMDYLLRDSRMCGVRYGEYDLARLVETVTLADGPHGPAVALTRAGLHAAEGLLLARYSMFQQVYFHRTRRILDLLLDEVLPDWPEAVEAYLEWDDGRLLERLRGDDRPAARAVWHRRLPACVAEMEVSGDPVARAEAESIAGALADAGLGRVWLDTTARLRAFRPEGDLPLVEGDGRLTSVIAASPVLRRMDPEVELRRVYVEREAADRARAVVEGVRRRAVQLRLF